MKFKSKSEEKRVKMQKEEVKTTKATPEEIAAWQYDCKNGVTDKTLEDYLPLMRGE